MFNTGTFGGAGVFGAAALGARAASRYGSGSDQMMRLRLSNTALSPRTFVYYVTLLGIF
jgi:hypothetical protein